MGGALVRGWIVTGFLRPDQITVTNRRQETAAEIARETGVHAAASASEAVQSANVLLIAVKPPMVTDVLNDVRDALAPDCLVISIATGVKVATLRDHLPPGAPIVRVVPNTPAQIGAGATGLFRAPTVTSTQAIIVKSLFAAVGVVVEVTTEEQIDAVTGLAGSGVAFFYLLIESLIDGGVRAGLPRDTARALAAQTALGAARMIAETGDHPGTLKDAVTTPGRNHDRGSARAGKSGRSRRAD